MPLRLRRFQFSLLTLLILATLAAAVSAVVLIPAAEARREAQIVAAIDKLQGAVAHEYVPTPTSWFMTWLVGDGPFRRVKSVSLNQSAVSDDDLALIGRLRHLRGLRLANTQVGDQGLQHLLGMRELRSLDLSGTRITSAGLETLAGLPQLEGIETVGTATTYADLERFQALWPDARLVESRARGEVARLGGSIRDDGGGWALSASNPSAELFDHAARIPKIVGADFTADAVSPARAELIRLRELANLRLEAPLTDGMLQALADLPRLTALALEPRPRASPDEAASSLSEVGLISLSRLTSLRRLLNAFSGPQLASLAPLARLQSLSIRIESTDLPVHGIDLEFLERLTDLEELEIRGAMIDDEALAHVGKLTSLERLTLAGGQIRGPGVAHLKGCSRLTALNLDDNPCDDRALEHIPGFPSLRWLSLKNTRITGSGLRGLVPPQQLSDIFLTGAPVTPEDVGVFIEARTVSGAINGSPPTVFIHDSPAAFDQNLEWTGRADNLGTVGEAAFWAGDYERMAEIYGELAARPEAVLDDYRWLVAAYGLLGRWQDAIKALSDADRRMMKELASRNGSVYDYISSFVLGRPVSSHEYGTYREMLPPRFDLLLLSSGIARFKLADANRAAEVLRPIISRIADPADPKSAEIVPERALRQTVGRLAAAPSPHATYTTTAADAHLLGPGTAAMVVDCLVHLAEAYEVSGDRAAALQALVRARLTDLYYPNGPHGPDPRHMARLFAEFTDPAHRPAVPVLGLVEPERELVIDPASGPSRLLAWSENDWSTFALVPPPGQAFAEIFVACEARADGEPTERWPERPICWVGQRGEEHLESARLAERSGGDWRTGERLVFEAPFDTPLVWLTLPAHGAMPVVATARVSARFRPVGQGQPPPARPGRLEGLLAPPEGGRYTLDGQPLPLGTPFTSVLAPGLHSLEYFAPGAGQPNRRELEITSDQTLPLFERGGNRFRIESIPVAPRGYPRGASVAQRADGSLLLAYTDTDRHQRQRIVFVTGDPAGRWSEPWDFALNDVFNTSQPALSVDAQGVIWLAYLSQRVSHWSESGGYHLWLSNTRDGRTWSRPRPVRTSEPRQYQEQVCFERIPDGRFLMLCGQEFCLAASPAELRELDRTIAPLRGGELPPRFYPSESLRATLDDRGRMHVLFDVRPMGPDNGRGPARQPERWLFYSFSEDLRHWSPPRKLRPFDAARWPSGRWRSAATASP